MTNARIIQTVFNSSENDTVIQIGLEPCLILRLSSGYAGYNGKRNRWYQNTELIYAIPR